MRQNIIKGLGSVNVTTFRVTSSLLHSPMRKRNNSNDMVHGHVSFGLHPPILVR